MGSNMGANQQSLEQLLKLLANRRRRYVLYYLDEVETAVVTLDQLADQLVEWEREWDRYEGTTQTHRECVRIALHHNHLPRLADANLIDYDARTETVRNWEEPSLVQWARNDLDELPRLRALFTASHA